MAAAGFSLENSARVPAHFFSTSLAMYKIYVGLKRMDPVYVMQAGNQRKP